MSFLVALALGIAGLAAAPLIAHLLRRGRVREQPFPPAALVPRARSVARESRRLEDRLLFAVRALMILALAVLGATPLVQCSRLTLARSGGASVALAIVLDDSLSMRAQLRAGKTRWERARAGALELSRSARRGDALAVVLAGRPARVLLPPTTDLEAVRRALNEAPITDRSTDLAQAVQLARSLVADLPQRDKQVAVLSDFAADPPTDGRPAIWAPLPELAEPVLDCAVISAVRQSTHLDATIACNSGKAAAGRKLEALAGDPLIDDSAGNQALASTALAERGGVQTVSVALPKSGEALGVRLSGSDAIAHDDSRLRQPRDRGLHRRRLLGPRALEPQHRRAHLARASTGRARRRRHGPPAVGAARRCERPAELVGAIARRSTRARPGSARCAGRLAVPGQGRRRIPRAAR